MYFTAYMCFLYQQNKVSAQWQKVHSEHISFVFPLRLCATKALQMFLQLV